MNAFDASIQTTKSATPAQPVAAELPYERSTPWFAQRRSFYIIVFLLFLNIVATTSISWGPVTMAAIKEALASHRAAKAATVAQAAKAAADQAALAQKIAQYQACLTAEIPHAQVTYAEDPAEAKRLLTDGRGAFIAVAQSFATGISKLPHPPVMWEGSSDLRAAVGALPGNTGGSLLFLHGMKTPAGRERIVSVTLYADRGFTQVYESNANMVALPLKRQIRATVYEPATATGGGENCWSYCINIKEPATVQTRVPANGDPITDENRDALRTAPPLRFVAGRLDPIDPTHAVLEFTLGQMPGALNIWLQDDDRLKVTPTLGSRSVISFGRTTGEENWNPFEKP